MRKQKNTLQELSDLLLAEIRTEPGCSGVTLIGLNKKAEPDLPANRDMKTINYRTSDSHDEYSAAKRSLIRLQQICEAKSE